MTELNAALCDFPMTDTGRRMGRPPLNIGSKTITTAIRLTDDVMRRIETVAGPNKMAAFIRDAIDEKLAREPAPSPAPSHNAKQKGPDTA